MQKEFLPKVHGEYIINNKIVQKWHTLFNDLETNIDKEDTNDHRLLFSKTF